MGSSISISFVKKKEGSVDRIRMQRDEYDRRVQEVHGWQRYYNMEPRGDSHLTRLYAEGKVDLHPAEVARELMATDFIFKNTLYGEIIEDFMREVAARVRRTYRLSWKATWDVVRVYAPPMLKLICLMQSGVRIPERLSLVPGP